MAEQNAERNHGQPDEIRPMIERAVAEALQQQIPQLQAQIVQRVLEALPAQALSVQRSETAAPRETSSNLVQSVSNIHASSTQKEILRALLQAGSAHCSRIALFVVKAGVASGWQSRGFGDDESTTNFTLDLNSGPAAHAYQNRVATPGNVAEMDPRFVEQFGSPANEQVLILPLTLKDKVAALIYADGGDSDKLDSAALELLVIATSAWLEVTSLRKQAAAKPDREAAPIVERPAPPSPVQTVSSFSDPFASHAPKHVPASPEPQPQPAEVVEVEAPVHAAAAAAPAAATDPWAGLSAEDADVHRKAQRFARLLVDEIKLYNQAKVAEGRRNKDLYDRLKEDIDKSRGTFQKRYGSTVAASADYFQHELLRSLAEDDVAVMGANFRH
jgi:hypothetical protein